MSIDLTGKTFGLLTVESRVGTRAIWQCRCACGQRRPIDARSLFSGNSKSCGCARRTKLVLRNLKHGQRRTSTYRCWLAMRERCSNPNHVSYSRYGGRGIRVCGRWKNFSVFLEDMGSRLGGLTIERKDTNGNYEPSNCKWANRKEQANNQSSNHLVEVSGEIKTIAQWSELTGVKGPTIRYRIGHGWEPRKAVGLAA